VTRRLAPHQRRPKVSSLTRPHTRALEWTPELVAALEQCCRNDMPVKKTMDRLGVSHHGLARGCMLRLRALLMGPS
jgi:hypothetical protein